MLATGSLAADELEKFARGEASTVDDLVVSRPGTFETG